MRSKLFFFWLIAGFVWSFFAKAAETTGANTNVFHSPTTGFTITKPAGWRFASMEEVVANRAIALSKHKEIDEANRKRANRRLVAIIKHQEPYPDLNPSAQVLVQPLGQLEGKSAVAVMHFAVRALKNAMKDFAYVEQIQEAKVGGKPAAFVKAQYTSASSDGKEFKTLSRMWVIPRGSSMIMISMSGPREGPDVSEEEFKAILASIEIDE